MNVFKELDALAPAGTRANKWARRLILDIEIEHWRGPGSLLDWVKEDLGRRLDDGPYVTLVQELPDLAAAESADIDELRWSAWLLQTGGYTAVYAASLRAIPDATEHIVLRASPNLPDGWFPDEWDGRWRGSAHIRSKPTFGGS
ncbi:hypothetical protein FHR32_007790 [Streptosporangium album]|uniref:Uncharacterized protein n=1 Tax=Streptosporangium album TaxID=47479 RepID=A0A7W7S3S6_9ACTN|nr:hypothetical protein [Streptosporangium album]MBB4943390.1 hypothetical protein [Streptosporangium album]